MFTDHSENPLDAVIIGAGAAGLTAAIYLARFRRRCIVLHADDSRAGHVPLARNVPGFPDGVGGKDLLQRLACQAERYGVPIRRVEVAEVEQIGGAFVSRSEDGEEIHARTILMATGSLDLGPDVPGLQDAANAGVFRICPICDGYEVEGRSVAVVGEPDHALEEARFLLGFGAQVTVLGDAFDKTFHHKAHQLGIGVCDNVIDIEMQTDRVTVVRDDTMLSFDHLYPAYGCIPRSELGVGLGLLRSDSGHIRTDEHQRTSVPGVWAAGDVVESLSQIAVAFGQAAIAATSMHNALRVDDEGCAS
jgi:thioredoxin reductase (NADPH)